MLYIQNIINHIYKNIKFTQKKHWDIAKINKSNKCLINKKHIKKYSFNYPYWPKSPTFFIKQQLGIKIIIIPLNLLNIQKYKFAQYTLLNPDRSQIKLIIAHHNSKTNKQISKANQDLLYGKETKCQDNNRIALALYYKTQVKNRRIVILTTINLAKSQFIKD